jgi:hypothetical protein
MPDYRAAMFRLCFTTSISCWSTVPHETPLIHTGSHHHAPEDVGVRRQHHCREGHRIVFLKLETRLAKHSSPVRITETLPRWLGAPSESQSSAGCKVIKDIHQFGKASAPPCIHQQSPQGGLLHFIGK